VVDAQHAPPRAVDLVALQAEFTSQTAKHRLNGDALTGSNVGHALADRNDGPRKFMSEDERIGSGQFTAGDLKVGAAQPGHPDSDAHVFGTVEVRDAHPADGDGGAVLDQCFHGGHSGDLSIRIGWGRSFARWRRQFMTHIAAANWWQSLYDDIVAELILVRKDPDELRATVAFLREQLHLGPGTRAFDQCCGIGSLALPLAREGIHVLGVDQSSAYIDRARAAALAEGLPCDFHAADAIAFVADQRCDAAFNWATGFGNADDEGNRKMVRCALETLAPGGRFALDYQHIPRVLRDFKECMVQRHRDERGEVVLLRESTVDLAGGSLRANWTFLFPDGRRVVRHSAVRLYLPHVLAEMLRACGFVDVAFHGGVRGEPLTLDSPRCILVARRPVP
jgi:SAM-dependent methyltransferase